MQVPAGPAPQAAFQPGSTPAEAGGAGAGGKAGGGRFLAYSMVGCVATRPVDDHHVVEVGGWAVCEGGDGVGRVGGPGQGWGGAGGANGRRLARIDVQWARPFAPDDTCCCNPLVPTGGDRWVGERWVGERWVGGWVDAKRGMVERTTPLNCKQSQSRVADAHAWPYIQQSRTTLA